MSSAAPMMSLDRLDELMRAVFRELIKRDGSAHGREVLAAVAREVQLTPTELSLNNSGYPRWDTNVRFHTSDCVRAGYLQKGKGNWRITTLGREALNLPPGHAYSRG